MEIILLEKVNKLGAIGDVVRVKDGFARNFLLPYKKAMRATKANVELIAAKRAELEARNLENKMAAEKVAEQIKDVNITLIRQAGDDGRLYGSVVVREIADALKTRTGHHISGDMVIMSSKIKEIGAYTVDILLHPDVSLSISLSVIRGEKDMLAVTEVAAPSEATATAA